MNFTRIILIALLRLGQNLLHVLGIVLDRIQRRSRRLSLEVRLLVEAIAWGCLGGDERCVIVLRVDHVNSRRRRASLADVSGTESSARIDIPWTANSTDPRASLALLKSTSATLACPRRATAPRFSYEVPAGNSSESIAKVLVISILNYLRKWRFQKLKKRNAILPTTTSHTLS